MPTERACTHGDGMATHIDRAWPHSHEEGMAHTWGRHTHVEKAHT